MSVTTAASSSRRIVSQVSQIEATRPNRPAGCARAPRTFNSGTTVDGRILIVGRRLDGRWYIAAHETVVRDQPE
jgi:hypothetical protein